MTVIDPVGVITTLIIQVEPDLDAHVVASVLAAVAPGRNVRRRLAQALAERPALLTDGRSPAPRVVGSLLIALRRAGAVSVAAPVCAGCGKSLLTLQRRGRDWYCGVCGPTSTPCVGCGKTRKIASRDRQGRPRCQGCPPDDDGDPMRILVEVITAVDPDFDTGGRRAGSGALGAAADRRTHRCRGTRHCPTALSALRTRHHAEQDPRRSAGMPQLLCQIARRNLLALRCPPRTSDPGRARATVVSTLPERRSGQPGSLFRLRSPSSGQRPHRRRAAVSNLPTGQHDDLRDLQPLRPCGDLQGHRATELPRLRPTAGPLHRLRHRPAGPRRHPRPAALRDLRPPRLLVLAHLSRMRRAHGAPSAPVRALHSAATPR
jgi:hypothetical protein